MLNQLLKTLFLCLLFVSQIANAEDSLDQLYEQGKYEDYISSMQKQIENQNGHVFYNLGNAYFRKGEMGQAMAAYLAARQLLPRDPDIKENLRYTHKKIQDQLDITDQQDLVQKVIFWNKFISLKEHFTLSMTLLIIGILIGLVRMFFSEKIAALLKPVAVAVLIFGSANLIMFVLSYSHSVSWGAVIVSKASVYSGPNTSNTVLFKLSEGAPFIVEAKENSWVKLRLSDGKKGWMQENNGKSYLF